ncbi:MAG: iron-sulfur cluster-binding oxidoreductase [Ignavibacteriae bacterium]|nr:iron-sulfur cluster-binding oxidoreductase [Ignavibacteriota bacterium]
MKKIKNENVIDNQSLSFKQWPIQLHMVVPNAEYLKNKELIIMSTCSPFFIKDLHKVYLDGKSVVIACPKLDYTEPYVDKLVDILKSAEISKAITVVMDEHCCNGLSDMSKTAAIRSERRKFLLEEHKIGINGAILEKSIIFEN